MDDKAQQYSISLYPRDWETLQDLAARFNPGGGRRNLSQALRFIISEWKKEHNNDPSGSGNYTATAV